MDSDDEFRGFVEAHYRTLVRAAVLFGCRPQDAEDAVQDALARSYAAWPRVVLAQNREGYVYRVLVNGISRGRRRRWHREVPHLVLPESAYGDDTSTRISLGQTLRAALLRLPAEQRDVLVLRYFADQTERSTAEILGIAPGTVKSRTARALAALSLDPSLDDIVVSPQEKY